MADCRSSLSEIMLMRHVLVLPLFACFFATACGTPAADADTIDEGTLSRLVAPPALAPVATEHPAEENVASLEGTAPAYVNTFTGTVAGFTFKPTYSFFLQGVMTVGDPQPTLVFVQTDSANLCQHMAAGTMPKNATIFATALVQTDGKPVQEGYSYTAPGHHGMDDAPRSMAFFRKLNETCEVFPDDTGAQAMYGQAIIRKLSANTKVVADYAFDFEEAGTVRGHVEAPLCDAPYFFANPEQFYQPVEPEQCLE
jgi:hypothetical protein